MGKTHGVEWSPDPYPKLLWVEPGAHSDQKNQSLGIGNVQVSRVAQICGLVQESVAQSRRGWRGGFADGQEDLLGKVTLEQGTEDRGRSKSQERPAAEYSGRQVQRARWGPAGLSQSWAVYPERSDQEGEAGVGSEGQPPHSGPTEDPGILTQETKRKRKKSGLCVVQKALQAILTKQPDLGTSREGKWILSPCRPGFQSQPHLLLAL